MKIENLLLTYENLAIVRKICPVTEKYLTNRGKLVRVLEVPLEKEKIGLDQELLKMSTEVVRINSLKGINLGLQIKWCESILFREEVPELRESGSKSTVEIFLSDINLQRP